MYLAAGSAARYATVFPALLVSGVVNDERRPSPFTLIQVRSASGSALRLESTPLRTVAHVPLSDIHVPESDQSLSTASHQLARQGRTLMSQIHAAVKRCR